MKRVVAFMWEIWREQGGITIKSDQVPEMNVIITDVGRVKAAAGGGKKVVESSPVGQSQSDGVVEGAQVPWKAKCVCSKTPWRRYLDQVGCEAPNHPVVGGVRGRCSQQVRGGKERQDRAREVQGQKGQDLGFRVRRGGPVEEKARRVPLGEVDVFVG